MSNNVNKPKVKSSFGLWAAALGVFLCVGAAKPAQALTLAWDASPGARGYKLYYGIVSTAYTSVVDVGNVTTNVVPGLTPGAIYFFAVTAYNASRLESSLSTEISVTVTNVLPAISFIPDQTINKNLSTAAIPFTVNDVETPLGGLTVQASSSNPTLLPGSRITLGGSGANRSITLSPALNQSGSATITVSVGDLLAIVTRTFLLTVTASNNAPVVIAPASVVANKETPTAVSGIVLSDADTGTANYSLSLHAGFCGIQVATNIAGGLTAGQVVGNGSGTVQITAPLAAMNATLSRSNGVIFTGRLNFAGADALAISLSDNGNSGSGGALAAAASVALNLIGNSLDTWRSQQFSVADLSDPTKEATVWGDKADPDQDGRDNLLEFALGLNPNQEEASQQAISSTIVDVGGVKYGGLIFLRRINEPLLQYIPEVSSDKLNWSSGAGVVQLVSTVPLNATFETVSVQDLTPISPGNPRFIRLRIVKP
jgi:hypothetical protein